MVTLFMNNEYPKFNIKELLKNKKTTIVSSEEALKDIIPIDWPEDIINGKNKIIVDINK
jgi:hypothetical protein